jgi:metal-responsive CopG/Arc/MetJ family transcriptional regulator
MSWISEKTGRPKEQGGHKRINVSLSKETLELLEKIKNEYGDMKLSQFIEIMIFMYAHLTEDERKNADLLLNFVIDLLSKFDK